MSSTRLADVQARLRASVPDSTFQLWLEPLKVCGARADALYLAAPDEHPRLDRAALLGLIREALAARGSGLTDVSFAAAGERAEPVESVAELDLNANYTFDRFVIGEGNRLAHAAALAVAEAPSEAYNPLFLHGPPGSARRISWSRSPTTSPPPRPTLSVRYTTAECFTNEFVAALRTQGAEEFKRRYRDLDVLLVDDVQFLEGKQHTEEEFFHTFNALYEGGSQLVLSADRIPSELSTLAARLRDRFEWGLTVAGRAAQPGDPPHRPAPPGPRGRASRPTATPWPSSPADRRQRPPAPRRPDPRDRPRLADRASRSAPS